MLEDGRCVLPEDAGVEDAATDADPGVDVFEAPDTGVLCEAGFGDCDGDPSNGCEQDLSERTHCGACGAVCAPHEACGATGCRAFFEPRWSHPVVGTEAITHAVALDPEGGAFAGGLSIGEVRVSGMTTEDSVRRSLWATRFVDGEVDYVRLIHGRGSANRVVGMDFVGVLGVLGAEFVGELGEATSQGGTDLLLVAVARDGAGLEIGYGSTGDDVLSAVTLQHFDYGMAGRMAAPTMINEVAVDGPFFSNLVDTDELPPGVVIAAASGDGSRATIAGLFDGTLEFGTRVTAVDEDGFVAGYQDDGSRRWVTTLSTPGRDAIDFLTRNGDSGYFASGRVESRGTATFGAVEFTTEQPDQRVIARLGTDGLVEWARVFQAPLEVSAVAANGSSLFLSGVLTRDHDFGTGTIESGVGVVVQLDSVGDFQALVTFASEEIAVEDIRADSNRLLVGGAFMETLVVGESTISGEGRRTGFVTMLALSPSL